jgi:enterochelin esterase-like enzyme
VSRNEAGVTDVLAKIPLVGWGTVITIAAIAVSCLIIAVLLWRNHKVWRWVFVFLFLVFGVGATGDGFNTHFAYYDNVAQLAGLPTYPTVDGNASGPNVQQQPNGAVTKVTIPDTNSQFGKYEANVWLPPQYFSDPRAHFPVVMLMHGNPGGNSDWLNGSSAAETGLAVAKSGKPVILVFPTVLQNGVTGDSLCLDTPGQGKAETYLLKDVVPTIDKMFRTEVDAKQRGIGGLSMGGYCALNLGLKHPELFSVALDFSGETSPVADTLPGGLQELFGANWQQQADANDPAKYWSQLNGAKGPAVFMYSGTGDTAILSAMQKLAPELVSKGFNVKVASGPGAHDFVTFGNGLKEALPWAAALFYPSS